MNYVQALVSFIDILGFGQMVQSSQNPDAIHAMLSRYVGNFHPNIAAYRTAAKQYGIRFIQFSDSIVRIAPIANPLNCKKPYGIVYSEILGLHNVQRSLALQGTLIRGGMSLDDIFADGTYFFGRAMNSAYGLESKVALYPRIVIEPKIFDRLELDVALRDFSNSVAQELLEVKSLLEFDEQQGLYYVDYLGYSPLVAATPAQYVNILNEHKAVVLAKAEVAKKKPEVAAKIAWVARYHNRKVRQLPAGILTQMGASKRTLSLYRSDVPELRDFLDT